MMIFLKDEFRRPTWKIEGIKIEDHIKRLKIVSRISVHMGPYLLRRRLRHVRSIKINNLSVGQKGTCPEEQFWVQSYFIVIENSKGEALYISEVQYGSLYNVQFNEMPRQNSPLTRFTLKLFAEVPQNLSPYEEQVWCLFKHYRIDLNKMQYLRPDQIVGSYNAPLLELVDGSYVLPDVLVVSASSPQPKGHNRSLSSFKVKHSFAFNYVLKLNKILEYKSQVKEESQQISEILERQMQHEHKKHQWIIENLKSYNQQLQARIQKKRLALEELNSTLGAKNAELDLTLDTQANSLNDYYGNTYPNLIQSRDKLENLRTKKLAQLVGIFQTTDLFHMRAGFVTLNQALRNASLYDRLSLELLNKEKLLDIAINGSKATKILTSTCLGYYMMFVTLVATRICGIPLPHLLQFCGSTSIVNGSKPLYLDNNKDTELLSQAIDSFNRDIIQIIQYLKHRQMQ